MQWRKVSHLFNDDDEQLAMHNLSIKIPAVDFFMFLIYLVLTSSGIIFLENLMLAKKLITNQLIVLPTVLSRIKFIASRCRHKN